MEDGCQSPVELKRAHRQFYDRITTQLNASEFGAFSYFLNLGYVPDGSACYSQVRLPSRYPNRTSVQLALELIADCPLTDRRLLDVGCGRGGTIAVVKTFFRPRALVGVDLSPAAVTFDQRTHGGRGVGFCAGDAEHLPFRDAAFDVVTNLESSHSYPRLRDFYAEAHRVLVPGGDFLYGDVLPLEKMKSCIHMLEDAGFVVRRARDVTSNVLRSCDQVARQRLSVFTDGDPLLENFLATPGSAVYENMRAGTYVFRCLTLQKPPVGGGSSS